LMYFLDIDDATGNVNQVLMIPMQIKRFQANRVQHPDAVWLHNLLEHQCEQFGTHAEMLADGSLTLRWNRDGLTI